MIWHGYFALCLVFPAASEALLLIQLGMSGGAVFAFPVATKCLKGVQHQPGRDPVPLTSTCKQGLWSMFQDVAVDDIGWGCGVRTQQPKVHFRHIG